MFFGKKVDDLVIELKEAVHGDVKSVWNEFSITSKARVLERILLFTRSFELLNEVSYENLKEKDHASLDGMYQSFVDSIFLADEPAPQVIYKGCWITSEVMERSLENQRRSELVDPSSVDSAEAIENSTSGDVVFNNLSSDILCNGLT